MDGVQTRSHVAAIHAAVRSDGLTQQERGMIDRQLFPRTGKGKRYVRQVRRQRDQTYCDMITEDANTVTEKLETVLNTYRCKPRMPGGRNRCAKLPEDIADKLQALTMPASLRARLSGRIPLRRRQQLQAKRLRKMEKTGPSGTRRKEPLAGTRGSTAGIAGVSRPYGRTHGGSGGEHATIGGGGRGERDHRRGIPRRGFPK